MNIAIIGAGYWGKNLIRNFNELGALHSVFDLDKNLLDEYTADNRYGSVYFGTDYTLNSLVNQAIEGVVIATPPSTHYELAMTCLESGKHVFIEKPMTLDYQSSKALVDKAKEVNKIIIVGHIFLYASEIIALKEVVNTESFGDILYIYTDRLNLGKVQDCGVLNDLAPHDISVVNFLTDSVITDVSVNTFSKRFDTVDDTAFIHTKSANGVVSNLNLSWLVPTKTRLTTVVGSKQTAVCDSIQKSIRLYNSNVFVSNTSGSYSEHLLNYKYGDVVEPFISSGEPLKSECQDFISCISSGKQPVSNGAVGLDVVKVLDAMNKSAKTNNWVKV